jgi:hypothetical protein
MAGSGAQLGRRGITAGGNPTKFHTGAMPPAATTTGTDTTPVITETYIAEVFVPCTALLTGISVLNGSAVAGNLNAILFDANGQPVASSGSVAQSGTAAYQALPFTATVTVVGPATYFVGLQCSSTSARFRSHVINTMGASKKTGETFGTVTAITAPTTFTTGLGPIASTY